jgi:hypothetical protein
LDDTALAWSGRGTSLITVGAFVTNATMSQAESESADAGTDEADDEEFTYYPQVKQSPTTIIEGEITNIVTGADLDSGVEDSGTSYGVVFENPTVEGGSLWKNSNIPDGFETTSEYNDTVRMAQADDDTNYVRGQEVTDEAIEAAQERLDDLDVDYGGEDYDDLKAGGVDYKVADMSDRDTSEDTVEVPSTGEEVTTGFSLGSRSFESEQADEFDADTIMVWYGGMSGQFIGRGLDFNGMPFARYTDDGYLVKGLLQAPIGWRGDADVEQFDSVPSTNRKELATDLGRPPRTARPPVLRDDLEGRTFIAIGRYNGGNMYEVHVGRAMDEYDDFLGTLRDNEQPEYDEIDMRYDQEPEERLADEFDDPSSIYALYEGEGWQSKPSNAQSFGEGDSGDTDGGSFDIGGGDDDGVDHPTDEETTFAKMVSEKLAGTDEDPDDVFDGGLDGLVEDNAENFDGEYDVEAIRAEVYEYTDYLDASDA